MLEHAAPLTAPPASAVKVNFGSAGVAVRGWINVDKSPAVLLARLPAVRAGLARLGLLSDEQREGFSREVVYGDASRRLRFADRSVDFIYSSHMIEHLSRSQGRRFVAESRRILRPGGRLRLATPDLAALVAAYASRSPADGDLPAANVLMDALHLFQDMDEGPVRRAISRNLSNHWHQWLYDAESLTWLLADAGFEQITTYHFRKGEFPDLDQIETRPESLFIQAQAPTAS